MAVKPIRAVLVNANSGQLQEVSIDRLDKIVAATVAKGVSLKNKTLCCRCFGMDSQTTGKGISQPSPPSSRQQEVNLEEMDSQAASERISQPPLNSGQLEVEMPVDTSYSKNFCCCCSTPLDPAYEQLSKTTMAALDKTALQIATTSGPQQLLNGDWI